MLYRETLVCVVAIAFLYRTNLRGPRRGCTEFRRCMAPHLICSLPCRRRGSRRALVGCSRTASRDSEIRPERKQLPEKDHVGD